MSESDKSVSESDKSAGKNLKIPEAKSEDDNFRHLRLVDHKDNLFKDCITYGPPEKTSHRVEIPRSGAEA